MNTSDTYHAALHISFRLCRSCGPYHTSSLRNSPNTEGQKGHMITRSFYHFQTILSTIHVSYKDRLTPVRSSKTCKYNKAHTLILQRSQPACPVFLDSSVIHRASDSPAASSICIENSVIILLWALNKWQLSFCIAPQGCVFTTLTLSTSRWHVSHNCASALR